MLYWRGWNALRYDRQYGAMGGQSPIGFVAIDAYGRREGLEGAAFDQFRMLICAMDDEWMSVLADKAAAEKGARGEEH